MELNGYVYNKDRSAKSKLYWKCEDRQHKVVMKDSIPVKMKAHKLYGECKGSLTVWALYAYFSDSQNAAFELLVWCM